MKADVPMPSKARIGSLIRCRRKAANLSQEELAERIHETRTSVTAWESGKRSPDANQAIALCRAFGVTLNQFLGAESTP